MKKIISLLLVAVMVFSLAACNTNNQDDPSQSTNPTNTNEPTSPTAPNASTPNGETNPNGKPNDPNVEQPEKYTWETKNITLPTFSEVEVLEYPVVEGWKSNAKIVKSPWQLQDYNPVDAKAAFAQSYLFKDWIFGIQSYEKGTMTNYENVGYRTSYTWEQSVVATNKYRETDKYSYGGIEIIYSGATQTIEGYKGIKTSIPMDSITLTKEVQDEIYKLLQSVYGEYAETLCYAPCTNKTIIMEVEQENATITLVRSINDDSIFFNMYMNPTVRTYHKDFPGNGEYISIANNAKYTNELLNPAVGSLRIDDFKNIGADMLKEVYDGYLYTLPETKPYFMRFLTLDNGHYVEYVKMCGDIATEELSGHFAPDFILEYTVVYNGTTVTDVELNFECGVSMVSAGDKSDAYYETVRTQLFDKACKMFPYVLKDEIDVANTMTKDESGKHTAYRFKSDLFGLQKDASIDFSMGYTMAGPIVGYIYYKIP